MDNLGKIGESLNTNFNESIEKELQQSFRLAAQSLTELFKGGKKATKKSYLAGKREALQDVLEFLQATLDHPLPPATNGNFNQQQQQNTVGPLNVARLIDYICARQETLKAEEQEEDNEETIPSRSTQHPHHSSSSNPTASTSSSTRPSSTPITSSHSQPPQQHSLNRRNDSIPAATSSAPSSPQRFSLSTTSNSTSNASAIASTSQLPSSKTTSTITSTGITSSNSIPFHQSGINSLTSTPIARTQTQILGHPVPFLPSSSSSSSTSSSSSSHHHQQNNTSTLLLPSSPLSISTTSTTTLHRKSLNPSLTTRKGKSTTHRSTITDSINEHGVLQPQQVVVGVGVGGGGGGGPSEETLLGSMKRRWTTPSSIESGIIELSNNDSLMGSDESTIIEGEEKGGEDQIMDFMEGWDARDERPSKRVSRR